MYMYRKGNTLASNSQNNSGKIERRRWDVLLKLPSKILNIRYRTRHYYYYFFFFFFFFFAFVVFPVNAVWDVCFNLNV